MLSAVGARLEGVVRFAIAKQLRFMSTVLMDFDEIKGAISIARRREMPL
jgi:hypothetical protein